MIIQLNHKLKDGSIEFKIQREMNKKTDDVIMTLNTIMKEAINLYPLPEGAEWILCTEKSKYFIGTKIDEVKQLY